MKHFKAVSKRVPAYAAPWQEIVCYGNQAILDVLTAKTGSLPILTVIADKCDIPTT